MPPNRLVILLLAFCFCAPPLSAQSVPTGVAYQGRLTDASNAPVPDGTGYEIEVRLWSASAGGTLLWGTRYTGVSIKGGAFNLILGAGGTSISGAATTDLKTVFNTPAVHLGLTATKNAAGAAIPSPAEILPRQQMVSSPYAFRTEVSATVEPASVLTASIKDGEVKFADIGAGEVRTASLADGAVTAAKILDGTIVSNNIAPQGIAPDRLAVDMALLVDEKPSGTNGGSSAAAAWLQRTLNKVDASQGSSISLSGNAITLKTGTYLIEARVPAYTVARHTCAIRQSVSQTPVIRGTSEHSDNANQTHSSLSGLVTVTNPTETFELWQYTQSAVSTIGLGIATSAPGTSEIYTTVKITRIK